MSEAKARLVLQERDGDMLIYTAPSWSAPARNHLVTLNVLTGEYSCSCPGFQHWSGCHHIPGWGYVELGSTVAVHHQAKSRARTSRQEPRPQGTTLGPVPPLYRDVIDNWNDHRAVFNELLRHDEVFRKAVAVADVNVMVARLWRIMFGIRVVPPPDYTLEAALHEAPPSSSIARWGRLARADPDLSKLLPETDHQEQARRAEGVKIATRPGGQSSFEVSS